MCWHYLNYLYYLYSVLHILLELLAVLVLQKLCLLKFKSQHSKSFTQCLTLDLISNPNPRHCQLPPTLGSQCCLHRNSRDCSLARCFFTLQWVLWISMLSKPARFRRYAEVGDIPNGSGEEIFDRSTLRYCLLFIVPHFKSCYLWTIRCQVCSHPS